LGGAALPAEAALVLAACESIVAEEFRLEHSIRPTRKTASRDPASAVRKLRITASHHDLPVARKAEEEKTNLDEEVGSPQA
jgi:hypothetical protein